MSAEQPCSDCSSEVQSFDRRRFLQSTAAGVAVASTGLLPAVARAADKQPQSETLVKQLFDSLNDEQRKLIVFPFDHELR